MSTFQEVFDKQKAYFDTDATKTYEWRIEQLTRLEKLLNENAQALEDAISSDFTTASQEKVFEVQAPLATAAFAKAELREWMKPVDVVVPKATSGQRAHGEGLPRTLWRHPGDWSFQRPLDITLRSGSQCPFGR